MIASGQSPGVKRPAPGPPDYDRSVFINCPFDDAYQPLFRALVFATIECGLRPRSALEVIDAGEVRIEKISRIIRDCRWGIHDVSRTELTDRGLPRFNMPLELGLFLGARRFGIGVQRRKSCLVLDRERFRYQEFMSDIAGQDICAHGNDPASAMKGVREWLAGSSAGTRHPPGHASIAARQARFTMELPAICAATHREAGELTFTELVDITSVWLKRELGAAA